MTDVLAINYLGTGESTLLTGIPGHGKTLFALKMADEAEKAGRSVYVVNVNGLNREWPSCDPHKWMDLPDNSFIVIDEAQDFFRMRSPKDPVPAAVVAMEKHRHRGFTFVFTCQFPKQLDFELRRYVGRHIHFRRVFGMARSVMLEHSKVFDPEDKGDVYKCLKGTFNFPKEVYGWYQSATQHNVKTKLPARVVMFPVLLLVVAGMAWYGVQTVVGFGDKLAGFTSGPGKQAAAQVEGAKAPGQATSTYQGFGSSQQPRDYVSPASYRPRIDGLMHTAPRFDELTKPDRVPVPAACVQSRSSGCKCYTQDATPYPVDLALCRQIVASGWFVDFEPNQRREQSRQERRSERVEQPPVGAAGGGGGGLVHIQAPAPVQAVASVLGGQRK